MPRMYGPKPKTAYSKDPNIALGVVVETPADEVGCDDEATPEEEE